MDISLKFNGINEVIRVIDEGGKIVELLGKETSDCPLIGSEIYLDKKLGEGREGTVFSIKFKDGHKANFVVKTSVEEPENMVEIPLVEKIDGTTYNNIIKWIKHRLGLGPEYAVLDIMEFNKLGSNPERKFDFKIDPHIILVPKLSPLTPCKLEDDLIVDDKLMTEKKDKKEGNFAKLIIPKGDYVCSATIVESVVSAFISKIIEKKICPHYIRIFSFGHCGITKSFTFMEEIHGDCEGELFRKEILSSLASFDAFIFQVFVAIYIMQKEYSVAHQDLHLGNIFLKYASRMSWKNNKLASKKYWRYDVPPYTYYIPAQKLIVKLGDWGFSAKYSHPAVLKNETIRGDFDDWNIPKTMVKLYDYLYFLASLEHQVMKIYWAYPLPLKGKLLKKINKIATIMVGSEDEFDRLIDQRTKRPKLIRLEEVSVRPFNKVLFEIFKEYKTQRTPYLQIV
jgi:hypothetical protein